MNFIKNNVKTDTKTFEEVEGSSVSGPVVGSMIGDGVFEVVVSALLAVVDCDVVTTGVVVSTIVVLTMVVLTMCVVSTLVVMLLASVLVDVVLSWAKTLATEKIKKANLIPCMFLIISSFVVLAFVLFREIKRNKVSQSHFSTTLLSAVCLRQTGIINIVKICVRRNVWWESRASRILNIANRFVSFCTDRFGRPIHTRCHDV